MPGETTKNKFFINPIIVPKDFHFCIYENTKTEPISYSIGTADQSYDMDKVGSLVDLKAAPSFNTETILEPNSLWDEYSPYFKEQMDRALNLQETSVCWNQLGDGNIWHGFLRGKPDLQAAVFENNGTYVANVFRRADNNFPLDTSKPYCHKASSFLEAMKLGDKYLLEA